MHDANSILNEVIDLIEIPPSYYKLAVDRYESLSRWFHRPESTLLHYDRDPKVYPQGSFRYGTVIRPILKGEYYDLDLVCQLDISKAHITQRQLKELVGIEIQEYAEANNFKEGAIKKRRCWRLNYADDVSFHMDILPSVPEMQDFINLLAASGVERELAELAIGITDEDHFNYDKIDVRWPSSNPRGYGRWFEEIMQPVSMKRRLGLVDARLYASTDAVPSYEWKTPLQRAIQLLKRHRDVMFKEKPDLKPISMIITTLAAKAYLNEETVYDAVTGILGRMLDHISPTQPRVANPVNPAEDFADRWVNDPEGQVLEHNFRVWHQQATSDFSSLLSLADDKLDRHVRQSFDVQYRSRQKSATLGTVVPAVPAIHISSSPTQISAPPQPWQE